MYRFKPSPRYVRGAAMAGLVLAPIIILGKALPDRAVDALPQSRSTVDAMATGSIAFRSGELTPANYVDTGDISTLKVGLDALSAGDMSSARALRDRLPRTSLDRHILAWAIAIGGGGNVSSREVAAAARMLSGWPGMTTLRENGERALYREQPSAPDVVAAFGGSAPLTAQGAIILARAYVELGKPDKARAALSPLWRGKKLGARDEMAIIGEFGSLIPVADHRVRMETMLYHDRVKSAGRVAALADASALWKAWAGVIRGNGDAGKLLDAVPAAQRSAGYVFAKLQHLRRAGKYSQAAALMAKAPRDGKALIDPDAWWVERRVLSREMVDIGDIKTAYAIAAAHAAESPANTADAEFHAGWYALRGLKQPVEAATHFARIARIAQGPISLSRAYYWLGRAAENGGPGTARTYFEKAAAYGATFYGQLAAARIGRDSLRIGYPEPTASDRRNFPKREAVRAIDRLEQAGYSDRADILYRDLADQLTSPGELALLATMAEKRGDHFLALRVGKIAAARGIDIGALAHPIGAIPSNADISSTGKALAYAIARQESEFNAGAVSGAGARGLLQLLPATARDMARRSGLPFSVGRLTTDAGYNATLGAAFLNEQLARFDGSYVLTFAGYNAGPRRAREWVARYGDPRGKDIDTVVDWIERIPFTETRNYVQRVMENYEVYKMRLSGKFDIVGDLVDGR